MDTTNGRRFVAVAVNSGQPTRHPFTYAIPPGADVVVGQAVFVPFGTRVLQGLVLETSATSDIAEVREIHAVADPFPVLDETHIALGRWLAETYLAPLWDCLSACMPSGYGQKAVTMVSAVGTPPLLPVYPEDQRIILFVASRGRVSTEAIGEALGPVSVTRLRRLQRDGYLTVAQGLARAAGRPRLERRVTLIGDTEVALSRAALLESTERRPVDARILRLLVEARTLPLAALRAAGATSRHLARLADQGLIRLHEEPVERSPLAGRSFAATPVRPLTPAQQSVVDRVDDQPGEYLVHGVTGSGKTEVYQELISRALRRGQGAIVLVPEISLTPQAIRRYGERFGETLAVFHSGLGTGELFDQWYRVQRGDARVVIGSRSALFVPVQRLGLIVIDEEHETSYKQESPQPRYHAREAARELARLAGASLVLGSATPDVVSYHRTEIGLAVRLELTERISPATAGIGEAGAMPRIRIVDMRDELRAGNRGVFSYPLLRAVAQALRVHEQSLLFVNRRGGARFVLCRDCGFLASCPSCRVSMGLDTSDPLHPQTRCHHCNRGIPLEEYCPRCRGRRYRPFGVGTQRIEQEAKAAFPGARVVRWDSETAAHKGSHERIVGALEAGDVDILVGTQILAKGLDLPAMTVVGVVDGDVGMHLPEYTAQERTFQLVSQVAGRAGRRDRPGQVFIQTYDPDNAVFQCAASHDYRAFYDHEIAHRRRAGYPPFMRLARLMLRHRNQEAGLLEASRVAADLRIRRDAAGRAEPEILGPTPAYIARLRGYYRWQLLLRGHRPADLLAGVRLGPNWTVDIDPMGLMW